MRVYIGYDPRDHLAYRVAEHTIKERASIDIEVLPLKDWELRQKRIYWRGYRVDASGQMWDDIDGKPFSSQFSFTRFAVPALEEYGDDWVLFMDADMMIRGDIAEVLDLAGEAEGRPAVMCVKHNHQPSEGRKMDGVIQAAYNKKNWSSFMLMKPNRCHDLSLYALNNYGGGTLHGMVWAERGAIGELPPEWNHLAGYDAPGGEPKNVHFTLGTPDMDGPHSPKTEWDAEWWDALDRARKGIYAA